MRTLLTEDFLAPYREKVDPFQSLLARSTYLTKYCRDQESWTDTIKRVVDGSLALDPKTDREEAEQLFDLFWTMQAMPPGRGLWVGGVEGIPAEARYNCWGTQLYSIEDWCWTADMLMLGGGVGVGLNYIDQLPAVASGESTLNVVCSTLHPDLSEVEPDLFDFSGSTGNVYTVDDSREGWVEALRRVLTAAWAGEDIVVDVSQVRCRGSRIKTFGGIASGPGPLVSLLRQVWNIVRGAAGRQLTSVECLDVTNHIGLCIKAGNVRRCLPGNALVHTKAGLIPIKDVKVGDEVLTSGLHSSKYMPVTAWVESGVQDLLEIQTQMGPFRCTPNHRVAVLDSPSSYIFKEAQHLVSGDRMVFVDETLPGQTTNLPSWSYDKPASSTTCRDLVVPDLNTDFAWFLGYFLGDGYTYANRAKNGFNAYISLAVAHDANYQEITGRIHSILGQLGANTDYDVLPSEEDDCRKIRTVFKQLAWYLDENFKVPNETLRVPECILKGLPEVRAAFLAGLLDSDGAAKNRPVVLCASVYPSFLEELRAVYASLGIPTRIGLNRPEVGNWQAMYHLKLVGTEAIAKFISTVHPYAAKEIRVSKVSQRDYGYPSSWVKALHPSSFWKNAWDSRVKKMVRHLYRSLGGETAGLVPVEVLSISPSGSELTYDIEVAGAEEFVADGLLVHNSALIVLGSPNDQAFRDAKKDWAAVASHRHTSNNSILFEHREQIDQFDWSSLVEDVVNFGEPGLLNLAKIRETDPEAVVVNPCFAGDTLIAVADGRHAVSIKQLAEEDRDVPVYSLDRSTGLVAIKTGRHPRITGYNKRLVRVWLDDGSYLDTTLDHKFILDNGKTVEAQNLKSGMSLPRFLKNSETVESYGVGCAAVLGLDHPKEDPQVVRTFKSMLEQGYNIRVHEGGVLVTKKCEQCSASFEVSHAFREHAFCSPECSVLSDIEDRNLITEVLEAGVKVVKVEPLEGLHTVYNITVDDLHTVAAVTSCKEVSGVMWYACLHVMNCGEINLHQREACNLAEVFPGNFKSWDPAYIHNAFRLVARYSLRQRLEPLKDPQAEAVRVKNMRVGVGLGGICDFDWTEDMLSEWHSVVRKACDDYADALGVSRPNATTTVKPSGTISLLCSSSPGIHAPYAPFYIRRVQLAINDPLVPSLIDAGVPYELSVYDKTEKTYVFSFPTKARHTKFTVQTENIRDQFERQYKIQTYWSDNAVSATLSFNAVTEKEELAACLKEYVPHFKSTSLLAVSHGYAQSPYEQITEDEYLIRYAAINHAHPLVHGGDMTIEECSNGVCPLK